MVLANGLNASQEGVQYQSTSGDWTGITGGTVGEVLTSTGPGSLPTYQPSGASSSGIGKWVLLSTQPCSGLASVEFTSMINGANYQHYVFLLEGITPAAATDTLYMRSSILNGAPYSASGYLSGCQYVANNSATFTNINNGVDILNLPVTTAITANINGEIYISTTNLDPNTTAVNSYLSSSFGATLIKAFSTEFVASSPVNAYQFSWSSGGNFQGLGLGGTITLYGILKTGGGGSGGGITWFDVTSTSASMTTNNGYVADNAGLVTLTLPSTANLGDQLTINGKGAGGWTIAQNANQSIQFGTLTTTVGVSGSLSSTNRYDTVVLQCMTAGTSTLWTAKSTGNLTPA